MGVGVVCYVLWKIYLLFSHFEAIAGAKRTGRICLGGVPVGLDWNTMNSPLARTNFNLRGNNKNYHYPLPTFHQLNGDKGRLSIIWKQLHVCGVARLDIW